jgi:hypothetical protein
MNARGRSGLDAGPHSRSDHASSLLVRGGVPGRPVIRTATVLPVGGAQGSADLGVLVESVKVPGLGRGEGPNRLPGGPGA